MEHEHRCERDADGVPGSTSLRLLPLGAGDRDRYVRWITDPESLRWSPVDDPNAEFERALRSRFNLVVQHNGEPIGAVAVEGNWDTPEPVVELGVIIDSALRRRGLGHQAVQLALKTAFDQLGAHRVVHGVYDDNNAVVEFFRRAGFTENPERDPGPDGRPAVHFFLTKHQWHALRSSLTQNG